ncbi:MAG: amino acid permease [Desulfobacterota bacterium]|nr:amino acid permease [Thermodesulfobacteriota bacterium]
MRSAPHPIGFSSATALVMSNMIGTGIFTSLGFQLVEIQHCASILLLWIIGAIIALCGALTYGELGAAIPRSGGEYVYLAKIYHPVLGFLSGFTSMTIGFAAPAAISSIAFGTYCMRIINLPSPTLPAVFLLCCLTILHCFHNRMSASLQIVVTAVNVCFMMFFIVAGLLGARLTPLDFCMPDATILKDIMNPAFAVSLVYVTYAYTGWNAAAYISGEMRNPQKLLPRSLTSGTMIVAALYLVLNYTFLVTAPVSELAGQLEVAFIAARYIFGPVGAKITASMIAMLLVASVSSLVFIGPRITAEIGKDIRLLSFFSCVSRTGIPVRAIVLQFIISIIMIVTTTFEQALTYVGFTLNLCSLLTVGGVVLFRARYPHIPRPFTIPLYPIPVILFCGFMLWNLVYLLLERPAESLAGLATVGIACLIYVLFNPNKK